MDEHNFSEPIEEELTARNGIRLENCCEAIGIETRTMIDMVRKDIFPAYC